MSVPTVTASPPSTPRARIWAATVTTVVVLALAFTGGLLASPDGGTAVIFVERISSAISGLANGAGSRLWWTYAFLLGTVSSFNPCGFALIPAYLGLYLNDPSIRDVPSARLKCALVVSIVVAAAFTALFGAIGAVFALGSSLIVPWLPWIGLAVGVVLIIFGGVLLAGGSLVSTFPEQVANRLGRRAAGAGLRGYATFGIAYGLASLGCALPLFLALLGTAVAAGGRGSAVLAFTMYGAGMATVFGALTVATSVVSAGIFARVRGMGRFVPGLGAVLLLASGAYVVYYWLTTGRLLLA